ncbi:coiled-coil domain-containing protein 28B isoform X3 [Schistocerca gregaria]|uniref:coiled-coil domain-containing protein 28B isoform X3 n=2 Tax=Schistocerca TaxID=7008 RepID=UPI00211EE566|nr:coiled-coil domain-containing protein 28B isoform X3 [Schistocerca gregaria]
MLTSADKNTVMAEGGEECELQQLVPPDDDSRLQTKSGEVTPPVTPGISKVTQTSPTSPVSNKVSSGGGSIHGSATSRTLNRTATAPSIGNTPLTGTVAGSQPLRLLFINEKLSHEKLSRGPSLSDAGSARQSRDARLNPAAARLHNTKRDVTDVRCMETALLHLLEDFHSGKLRAFGKDCSMEQMTGIREQQEQLARLHFDLGAQQELFQPLSDEGLRAGQENMQRLMDRLEQLSISIERLHSFSSDSHDSCLLQD